MAKYRLIEEEAAPKVAVVGISCHVPDYRLCWSLNRALGLGLTRRRADITEQVRGKELHYSVFEQADPGGNVRWALVCNTCGRRRLLPDQKLADLFLVVDEEMITADLLDRVRGAEFVLTAYTVEMSELKSGHKLLL